MPLYQDVNIDAPLSTYALDYLAGGNFVADILAPIVKVKFEEGSFHVFNEKGVDNDYDTTRADGAEATEVAYSKTDSTYEVVDHALKFLLTDRMVRNSNSVVDLEQRATRFLIGKIRLDIEQKVEALLTNTSTFSYTTPTTKWDAASGQDIFGDIRSAKSDFMKQCGRAPTHIVFPDSVASVVENDSDFLDRIKYTKGDLVESGSLPPKVLGMKTIVPGQIVNEAEPGITESVDFVWDSDKVGLYYIDPNPGPQTFTVANQFRVPIGGTADIVIRKYREERKAGTYIEAETLSVPKVVSSIAGYILNDVLT